MRTREELIKRIIENVKCPYCRGLPGVACLNKNKAICHSRVKEAKKQGLL